MTADWRHSLRKLVAERRTAFVVTERMRSIVGAEWAANVSLLYTADGENQKSWTVVERLSRELEEMSFPRDGLIVGIGGGATTDLTGFVASIWMRGVDWIAVPTTLAGMVDAAIGGKTGINGLETKNLIGSFHLPIATFIDTSFLSTLPERDINAGMAEILKCGFIADKRILELAQAMDSKDSKEISSHPSFFEMIERAVSVKERIVSKDLKENGERVFLNYGHTLGHAIERSSQFSLRHGEAVAVGMVFAASLSKIIHGLSDEVVQQHLDLLRKFELPVGLTDMDSHSLINMMWRDKKVKAARLRFVTLRAVGDPVVDEVDEVQLQRAFEEQFHITGEKK